MILRLINSLNNAILHRIKFVYVKYSKNNLKILVSLRDFGFINSLNLIVKGYIIAELRYDQNMVCCLQKLIYLRNLKCKFNKRNSKYLKGGSIFIIHDINGICVQNIFHSNKKALLQVV